MEKERAANRTYRCQEGLTRNSLTGLLCPPDFMEEAGRFLAEVKPDAWCAVTINILHFRMFNKLYGRDAGDCFLRQIADHLEAIGVKYGGITGYFHRDDFCAVMPWRMDLVERLRDQISEDISRVGAAIGVLPVFGVSPVDAPGLSPETIWDRASLAMKQATPQRQIVCYSPDLEQNLEEDMCLLSEVTDALSRDEFTFYVQPQCDITSGKVVGAESLVRWNHGAKGLIPPGRFIPALERCGAVYLLDQQIWEQVCRWLRGWIDRGYEPVPISINISRIDIMAMDVPAYLKGLLEKYDLPARYIKAEITESACTQEDLAIVDMVDHLRQDGFLVMMDDFGSGYSSLNMLKSIPVDVLKIDMRFLEITEENEQKGIGILESIVNMARLLGMPVIVEGVETQRQESVLRGMGCRYTQGYYYYRPLPIDQFESLLADERQLDFTGLHCKQVEAFHIRELMDGNLFTDMILNHILGPVAICDVFARQVEITRVNEQYYRMAGLDVSDNKDMSRKVWSNVRDDDQPLLLELFERAYERRPGGAEGNIHYLRADGKVLWLRLKVFFLREKEGHRIYFVSSEDVTALREKRKAHSRAELPAAKLGELEHNQLEQYYGALPCGFGLSRIALDQEGEPVDYEIVYINQRMERMCGSDLNFIRSLILKAFKDDFSRLLRKAYQAAFLGETVEHFAYSSVSGHYLQLTLFQHDYGYVACLLQDVTYKQLHEGAFNSMVLAYREVYYLQLQDNYCRMIYPDQTSITERGNYSAMVERHFGTGRILKYDEKNVRSFLSLEHLREALKTQNSVDYRYRRSGPDSPDEWCQTSVIISQRENEKPKTAIITIQSIDKIMREEEERQQARMAESLANMSDAFFIYRAIEDERILYANPAVMELFGCESMAELMEQVQFSFRGMVHPEDLARVEWEIQNQLRNSDSNMDHVRYRIVRRDGEIRWVDDYGHLETSQWGEEHRLFYVFLKDITDTLTSVQKEKLLNSNRFYQ